MTEEASTDAFPRGTSLPKQTPLYWVAEKDRYLRQILIRDIEALTGRDLVVYFTETETADNTAQIHPADDTYLAEVLRDAAGKPLDFLLETNGGYTDATEKVVALLRACTEDLRVIVPRRAKSNGTLIALAAKEIVMGPSSELGPIDPNINLNPQTSVPTHFILQTPAHQVDPLIYQAALSALQQTQKLATNLLQTGMMASRAAEVPAIVEQLATRNHFYSHGSVLDADEAAGMGLNILKLAANDAIWEKLWLLRCMYSFDMRQKGLIKIFESRRLSNSLSAAPTAL